MSYPTRELSDFLRSSDVISYTEITFIINLTRQILEMYGLKNDYKVLNFYCNWTLHNKLTKSNFGFHILEQIAKAFKDHDTKKINIKERVSEIVSLKKLREDFIELYQKYSLPITIFISFTNWKEFCGALLHHILNKPIEFPKNMLKKTKSVKKRVENEVPSPDMTPINFCIIKNLKNKPMWKVKTKKGVFIIGFFDIVEEKEDFLLP